jgi:hypothetical protein
MAGQKRKLATTNPPCQEDRDNGFIEGDRGPPQPPQLRPPELEKKEEEP